MDYITKELNKKYNDKYEFLRLYSVQYDKSGPCCKLIFLFPEQIEEINEQMRNEINSFISNLLLLNAKIIIVFKKSFLREDLIKKAVLDFLNENYVSLSSALNTDGVYVEKNNRGIDVKIELFDELCDFFQNNNISQKLKEHLEFIFYSFFDVYAIKSHGLPEDIIESNMKKTHIQPLSKSQRYKVLTPENFIGKSIEPQPELIVNQKQEKTGVILAGYLSNLETRAYKSKRNKNKENHLVSFDINDTTSRIRCVHFASKTNEPKLVNLTEGCAYLFLGDLRNNNYQKLNYYVNSINYCEFDPKKVEEVKNQKSKVIMSESYQFVFPKVYMNNIQETIFGSDTLYNEFIMQNELVVFDVETTGLDPENCEIIEIGAVKVVGGKLIETFQTLVRPKKEIQSFITDITGIDNEMVKDAPDIIQAITDFALFTKNAVLVGYNVNFDKRFIKNAGKEIDYPFANAFEDAMVYARNKLFLGNYTLKNVAKNLGVSLKEAHRALNDAIATAKVLLQLNKKN